MLHEQANLFSFLSHKKKQERLSKSTVCDPRSHGHAGKQLPDTFQHAEQTKCYHSTAQLGIKCYFLDHKMH